MKHLLVSIFLLASSLAMPAPVPVTLQAGDPSPDWISAAQREIAKREYRATKNGEGLQAPNRAHDLRTYFESTGIRVHDRTAPGSPELASLRLAGVGRGESLSAVAPGEVTSDGARVEIERPDLIEWYVNSEAGIEQGFTIEERPAGTGPLVFEVGVDEARAKARGNEVTLESKAGRKLSYGKLVVLDANSVRIAAHFEVPDDEHVRLIVEDGEATYPLVIDPLLTQAPDAQIQAGQVNSLLGYSAAGAGDVNGDGFSDVIVGAILYDSGEADEGAAFLYLGSAVGIASGGPTAANAQFESNQAGANLGSRVASAGDVNGDGYDDILIGAYAYDAGETDEGAFFLYLGSAAGIASGGPTAANAQIESNQENGALFAGDSAGDVNGDGYGDIILGASNYEAVAGPGVVDTGAAFVFLGSATGIASGTPATAATRLASSQVGEFFASSVSSAGDVNGDGYHDVIVGAPFSDMGETNEGAAYLYLGSAAGIADGGPGTASAVLQSDQAAAELGFSLGSAGDVNGDGYSDVIVGAVAYDSGQGVGEGSAFVFHGSASGIASGNPTAASTRIEANQASANLGTSVSGAGDVNGDGYADVMVGAYAYDDGSVDEGVALVYLGGSSGVASGDPGTAFAKLESNQADGRIGFSVDAAGDVNGDGFGDVITGAYTYDSGQGFTEGAAFVFLGGAEGVLDGSSDSADSRIDSGQANANLGLSVAGAGDVNGDGYSDVILGAPDYDSGQTHEGAAFVLLGSAAGIASGGPAIAAASLESNQAGSRFGYSVSGAGDVDSDGFSDVIVGAPFYGSGQINEGAAFVFLGSATGIATGDPTTAAARLESDQPGGGLGISVSEAGDVNGDGYADVIVGAYGYDAGQPGEGAAFVFLGGESGIGDGNPQDAIGRLESDQANAQMGYSVSSAGDVNGDGYSDVLVGAFLFNGNEGAAFIFLGSTDGIGNGNPATAATRIESDQEGARLGAGVGAAGDVNGDGFGDVIVGSYEYDSTFFQVGAAFVFHGSPAGIEHGTPVSASTQLISDRGTSYFGRSVDGAGDLNGDGYADVVVGAPNYGSGAVRGGAVFVFSGSAAGITSGGPSNAAARIAALTDAGTQLGNSVAGAGDVNGDGYADLVVGAPTQVLVPGQQPQGTAFVFLGNADGDGRPVLARQLRSDAANTSIQPGGWTGDLNSGSFEVRMRATHPLGRGRVKLEVEACAQGVAFGNVACTHHTSASWSDVTVSSGGVELAETIGDLAADTHYRWRARVLYAPYSVTQAGIMAPINPEHGPWRRMSGQANETDLLPEPGMAISIASGFALLALLQCRRRATAC